jgi:hypothetical protein
MRDKCGIVRKQRDDLLAALRRLKRAVQNHMKSLTAEALIELASAEDEAEKLLKQIE